MTEADACLLVLCTCPDRATALTLARRLVETRLAACVNVLDDLTSVYRWQGTVQEDGETLLLAKTTAGTYAALEAALRDGHPYDVPEVIAVPVERGSDDYLAWVRAETAASDAAPARSP